MLIRLRMVYLPFLIIAVGFNIIYSLLNWLVCIKAGLISLDEDITNLWLPLALVWIPAFIWLKPRISILSLKGGNGNLPWVYFITAALAIAIPTIITQTYLEKTANKLILLNSIKDIENADRSKYYKPGKKYIDKINVGVHYAYTNEGKFDTDLGMNIYVVLPILESEKDTSGNACHAWLGIKHHERISNSLSDEEKDKKFREFAGRCEEQFNYESTGEFVSLERVTKSADKTAYAEAVSKNNKYTSAKAPVFVAMNSDPSTQAKDIIYWLFNSFVIGAGIWLLMILFVKTDDEALEQLNNKEKKLSEGSEWKSFFDLLKFKEGYLITPVLICLNSIIFLAMVFAGLGFFSFTAEDLLHWGANYGPSAKNGEWWRLLTSTFLHGGIIHIAFNMYGLLYIGLLLEPALGKTRFLLIYLVTGILASCASLWWYEATVSVGASGAIFGMYGVFLALLIVKVFPPDFNKVFLSSTLFFVGYNLLMGLVANFDNAAHIGGLLSGMAAGFIISVRAKQKIREQRQGEGVENANEQAHEEDGK